jgi:predicted acetyltransferase
VIPSASLSIRARADILDLCSKAYEENFAPYLDLLAGAVHVLLRDQTQLVAHAAWIERELVAGGTPLKTAFIEAVAVSPACQRQGFGSKIMSALPPLLSGFDLAALSPSEEAFYRRLGWETWEGPLSYKLGSKQIDTPDECVMIYRLPQTPRDLAVTSGLMANWREGEIW